MIGRATELERMIRNLVADAKNNPLFGGRVSRCRKTAMAEVGLCRKIVAGGDVPELLKNAVDLISRSGIAVSLFQI